MIEESQVSSGPTMMFATVDYPDCCNKTKTEEIGTRWAAMLRTSGMDISTYVIEDDQVLFSSQTGLHAGEIKECASNRGGVGWLWTANLWVGRSAHPTTEAVLLRNGRVAGTS